MRRLKINTRAVLLGSRSFRLRFTPFYSSRACFLRRIFALNFSASDPAHYLFPRRHPCFRAEYLAPQLVYTAARVFLLKLVLRRTFSNRRLFSRRQFPQRRLILARLASRFVIFYLVAPCHAILSLLCCRSLRLWISRLLLRNFYSRPLWNSRILGRFRF